MPCTKCNGDPPPPPDECEACGGYGYVEIHRCPYKELDEDVLEALVLADAWKKGIPPTTCGGAGFLDQTMSITEACRLIWAEQNRYREERAKKGELALDGLGA